MIDGVRIKQLKTIPDERGRLMEMMRCDDEIFDKFGQVYLTTNYPQVVKAWHYHRRQTDYICCVKGMIKVVLYDARANSPTFNEVAEFVIGDYNPMLIKIPQNIYHGWNCISSEESLIICVSSEPYDYKHPDEFRLSPDSQDIPYEWNLSPYRKHG